MSTSTLFLNGTTWLRADFHVHTKADKEFAYDGNENDFISEYIDRLVEQNIRVGVITNHNKFDKGEFVAKYGNPVIRNNQLVAFTSKTMPFRGLGLGIRRAISEQPNVKLINDVEGEQFIVKIPRLIKYLNR